MDFIIHYDEQTVRNAVNTFMKRRLVSGFGWLGLLAVGVTIGSLAVLLWQGDRSWVVGTIGTALLIIVLLIAMLWRWRHAELSSKLAAIPSRKGNVKLSDHAITIATEAGSTELPWTSFSEVWRLEDVWLLFLAPNNFVTLPTKGVPTDALDYISERIPETNIRPQ